MPSKYFLPKQEDLSFNMVQGEFYCDECNEQLREAKHFYKVDIYAWQCSKGHVTKYSAEEMING